MDIAQYLGIEFQVYPRAFRDICAFLAKHDVRQQVENVPDRVACRSCHEGDAVCVSESSRNGDRYHYRCNHCGKVSGPGQTSSFSAYWQWVGKRDRLFSSLVPIVRADIVMAKRAKLASKQKESKVVSVMTMLSAIKWVKWVWAQHRDTEDYQLLSLEDRQYVDAIGVVLNLFRTQTMVELAGLGVDIKTEAVGSYLDKLDEQLRDERRGYYPRYQSRLTPAIRFKIKDELKI